MSTIIVIQRKNHLENVSMVLCTFPFLENTLLRKKVPDENFEHS